MTIVAIVGSTGRAGGWVLEEAIEKGYSVKALVRKESKLENYRNRITIVEGDATDPDSVGNLIENSDVVISTIGSRSKDALVVTSAARALVQAIKSLEGNKSPPRVVWMTTVGVNDAIDQGHKYGCTANFLPSCSCCCGYGLMGCLVFKCLIPHVIGQNLWDDMGTSEDVFQDHNDILERTVIVRPTNMWPVSAHATFSDEWREEGGENVAFVFKKADDPPPNIWVSRRAIAAGLLSLVSDKSFDGTAISLFQGEK